MKVVEPCCTNILRYSGAVSILIVVFLLLRPAVADQVGGESGNSRANRETYLVDAEAKARTHGFTYGTAVGAPMGRLLLMRKGGELCAIRFTEYHRGGDAKPPTMFHSGDESLYGEYDWFDLASPATFENNGNGGSGHEKLVRKAHVGFGHLHIMRGDFYVKCGTLSAEWFYPNKVSLIEPYGVGLSNGIELAPTRWQKVEQIDRNEPSLVWYKYDDIRKKVYLPMDELPGS